MKLIQFIQNDVRYGKFAYICLAITFMAILLLWSAILIFTIHVQVGDQINMNVLILLNQYANGCMILLVVAVLSGIAAFIFSIGRWERVVSVSGLLIGLAFFWLFTCVHLNGDAMRTYEMTTSTEYASHAFNVIRVYRSGDVVYQADYLLLDCDHSADNCAVTNQFNDFRLYPSTSKPASFFIDAVDNALYLKVGDETTLVSKV
jgi:hypothetical protein